MKCEQMIAGKGGWSDWVRPLPGYLMQCCDCDLIHEMEFAVVRKVEDLPDGRFTSEDVDDPALLVMFRARRHAAGRDPADVESLAAQCRMQARASLDPEYERFMYRVAEVLSGMEGEGRQVVLDNVREEIRPEVEYALELASAGSRHPVDSDGEGEPKANPT